MDEQGMLRLFASHKVISNKILRDQSKNSRGVGFARMETREAAHAVIAELNGQVLSGSTQPLQVRFADSEGQKRLKQQYMMQVQQHHHHQPGYQSVGVSAGQWWQSGPNFTQTLEPPERRLQQQYEQQQLPLGGLCSQRGRGSAASGFARSTCAAGG
ncbi:hypothetical protein HK405_015774 [Cladochytrium tenue]|nr:hypothetical protein HK405_015774 [Cladochytrium tenue]